MPLIETKVDRSSDDFKKNREAHEALADDLRDVDNYVMQGGPERSREKHLGRGKLLARDRIARLLDDGAHFLEIGRQAAWQVYPDDVPSAGIVTGIGRIHGLECMIVVNDATVKGGTYYPLTVKKHLRAQEIAEENHLPCVYLVDSGGAFLPRQDEVFPDRDHFGRIVYNQARLSGKGIPPVAVVMGSCTAGGAYVPAIHHQAFFLSHLPLLGYQGVPHLREGTYLAYFFSNFFSFLKVMLLNCSN